MKKNLRIVSAAAAALLAVAPVAATVVPAASTVSAATTNYTSSTPFVQNAKRISTKDFYSNTVTYGYIAGHAINMPSTITVKAANGQSYDLAINRNGIANGEGITVNGHALNEDDRTSDQSNAKYETKLAKLGETYTVAATFKVGGATPAINQELANRTLTIDGKEVHFGSNGQATVTITATVPVGDAAQTADSSKPTVDAGEGSSSIFNAQSNTSVVVNAVAAKRVNHTLIPGAISGSVSVSLGGKDYTALLHTDGNTNNVVVRHVKSTKTVNVREMTAGHYVAVIRHATVALDPQYANTTQTFNLAKGTFASNNSHSKKVPVDANGVADLGEIDVPFYAYDATKEQGVHFYEVATGNVVTSGSVNLQAVNGQTTVQALYAAMNDKYGASQFRGGLDNDWDVLKPVNDLKEQLEKQNIKVSDNGYFTAPASFTVNMNAKSSLNGATATLPVTVNVAGVTSTPAQETTKTVTIMHISTIYDKNGKATHDPALRAYDTYSVVSTPVTLKDEKGNNAGTFYKLAGKDQYIKVGNVDGTSRSLKHNSYVYKSTGKRNGKKVLKKGSSVTTYGKSFMIAGHQMYRIGRNQYVKKANF